MFFWEFQVVKDGVGQLPLRQGCVKLKGYKVSGDEDHRTRHWLII